MDSSVPHSDGNGLSSSQTSGVGHSDDMSEVPTWELEKEKAVREACKWKDLDQLRTLAESRGGFLFDEVRQQACM